MSVSSSSSPASSRDRVFSPDDFKRERRQVAPPQSSRFRERERELEKDRERERQRQVERERRRTIIAANQAGSSSISNENRAIPTTSFQDASPTLQKRPSSQTIDHHSVSGSNLARHNQALLSTSNISTEGSPTSAISTPSPTNSRSQGSSPNSATFPHTLVHRASIKSIRSTLQEEAENEWATYRPRVGLPPTARPVSSFTKSILSQDGSSTADLQAERRDPVSPYDQEKYQKLLSLGIQTSEIDKGKEVEAREEAIRAALFTLDRKSQPSTSSLPLRNSSTSSNVGNRSSNESEAEEALLPSSSDQASSRRVNRYSRAFASSPMGRNHSQPSHDSSDSGESFSVKKPRPRSVQINPSIHFDLGLPITKNNLSVTEKRDQLRRNQKLARVLGEEVLASSSGNEEPRSPLEMGSSNRNILKRIDLNRRKSDSQSPEFLSNGFQPTSTFNASSNVDSELLRRRSRSATFVEKAKAAGVSRVNINSHSIGTSNTLSVNPHTTTNYSLPADVHPKAAALLGISSSHLKPTLNRRRSAADTISSLHSSVSSFEVDTASISSLEAPGRLTRDETSNESQSSRTHPALISDGASFQSFNSEDDDNSITTESRTREERRKRVAKMTRWLGAVVPVDLIVTGNTEAMEFTSNEDASPTEEGSQRTGFGRAAKSAALNKLKRRNSNLDNSNSFHKRSESSSSSPPIDEALLNFPNGLSAQERFNNVKRANKLANVFGIAPPQQLYASTSPNTVAQSRKVQHAHSHSVPNSFSEPGPSSSSRAPERPRKAAERSSVADYQASRKLEDEERSLLNSGSSFISLDSDSSSAYRQSIESLEYLLDNDIPLLSQIVSELDSDSPLSASNGGSRLDRALPERTRVETDSSLLNPFDDTDTEGEGNDSETFEASTPTMERFVYSHGPPDQMGSKSHSSPSRSSFDTSANDENQRLEVEEEVQYANRSRMRTSASISSIDSPVEAYESDSEHELRRQRASRARKLNRFFGEAPPPQEDNEFTKTSSAKSIKNRGGVPSSSSMGTKASSSGLEYRGVPKLDSVPSSSSSVRKRLAPRSAGTATPAVAFAKLLNNLEDEVLEDDHLKDADRKEIAERVARIKRRGNDLMKEN